MTAKTLPVPSVITASLTATTLPVLISGADALIANTTVDTLIVILARPTVVGVTGVITMLAD